MPPPYRNPHFNTFAAIPNIPQGPVGYIPATWATNHNLTRNRNVVGLPQYQLNRLQVRAFCRNPANHVLFGYLCAMAWGFQGAGPGGRGHVASAWAARKKLIPTLTTLRSGSLTRVHAYNLFTGASGIPGLGPSYFTKLLYFFSPSSDFYIMDQWTGKSVDLLTGNWTVQMPGNGNKGGNYQAYCEEVDLLAGLLHITAEQVEERMFSQGGRQPRPWRAHVRKHWIAQKPVHRYSAARMHRIYPHIPSTDF
jgi:hypothetical protein